MNFSSTQIADSSPQNLRLKNFEYGMPGFRPPLRRSRIHWCSELKYLQPPKNVIALASFPGSGNTWLRYLLQQATGIFPKQFHVISKSRSKFMQVSILGRCTKTTVC